MKEIASQVDKIMGGVVSQDVLNRVTSLTQTADINGPVDNTHGADRQGNTFDGLFKEDFEK